MKVDRSKILDSLKEYKGFGTKADFARFLDIKTNTLSNWYSRNSFDEEILSLKFPEIDDLWLATGKGEMLVIEAKRIDKSEKNTDNNQKELTIDEKIDNLKSYLETSVNHINSTLNSLLIMVTMTDEEKKKIKVPPFKELKKELEILLNNIN